MFYHIIEDNTNLKAPLHYRDQMIVYDKDRMTHVVLIKNKKSGIYDQIEVGSIDEGIEFINDCLDDFVITNPSYPDVTIGIKQMDTGHAERVILLRDKKTGKRFILKQKF